jgi:hypothetical protein
MPISQAANPAVAAPPPEEPRQTKKAARPTASRPTAVHSRARSGVWNTLAASSRTKGSSAMSNGCTSAMSPSVNAVACTRNPSSIAAIPASHTGLLTKFSSSCIEKARSSGSSALARRCSTDAQALSAAATKARTMTSTLLATRCDSVASSEAAQIRCTRVGGAGSSRASMHAQLGDLS